ncbi:MAG: hypothetical protein IIB19_00325 [Chloroflexi bacterium]|nr:hypothetical protein [Chloroflexota bacterium]
MAKQPELKPLPKQPELKPPPTPTDKLREARRQTVGKAADIVQHALHNANGVELLALMEQQFPGAFHVDPTQHAFNAGQRSVIVWIAEHLDFTVE